MPRPFNLDELEGIVDHIHRAIHGLKIEIDLNSIDANEGQPAIDHTLRFNGGATYSRFPTPLRSLGIELEGAIKSITGDAAKGVLQENLLDQLKNWNPN